MRWLPTLLFLFRFAAFGQDAATTDAHAEDRKALSKVMREVEASSNEQNIDQLLRQMDPGATVTWWNGEVSRGHADIKAYYERMMKLEGKVFNKYTSLAKLGASARFIGNGEVAIADGSSENEFFPVARGPIRLNSRWSSTLIRTSGEWKIVSLHLSANVFNNMLIDEAKRGLWFIGLGGLSGGLLLGWFLDRMRQRVLSFFVKVRSGV